MPYMDNDKMINDLLSSMNLDLNTPRDKTTVNGQLAKKALEYKFSSDEEYQKSADTRAAANKLIRGDADTSDSSGGNDFNMDAGDMSDIISSFIS